MPSYSTLACCLYNAYSVYKLSYWLYIRNICTANRCSRVPEVQKAVPDSYLAVKGSTVHYTCVKGFTSPNSSTLSTVCNGFRWSPAPLPCCEGSSSNTLLTKWESAFWHAMNSGYRTHHMKTINTVKNITSFFGGGNDCQYAGSVRRFLVTNDRCLIGTIVFLLVELQWFLLRLQKGCKVLQWVWLFVCLSVCPLA